MRVVTAGLSREIPCGFCLQVTAPALGLGENRAKRKAGVEGDDAWLGLCLHHHADMSMMRRTFLLSVGSAALARPSWAAAPRLRSGQIGTAHPHAAGKMQAMRAPGSGWDVAGIVEPDARRRAALASAQAYHGLPLLTEEDLLNAQEVKAVAVETSIEDSCATALRVIRAGKHVHLDKPGSLGHAEFTLMRREAERRGLTVQMGYMLRYNPAFELMFRAVREGWLGEVMEIDAIMGKLGDSRLRTEIKSLPGGGLFELGCHVIDAIVTILGRPRAVSAFNTPSRNDGVPDNQLAVLEYPKATASVRVNFADPFGGPRRRFSVSGTEGTFEISPMESGQVKLSLTTARGRYAKGTQTFKLESKGGRYDEEFVDLARVVRGEKALAWTADHDIAVHETVLRASGVWQPTATRPIDVSK
jgi:predicted dehydrogenase